MKIPRTERERGIRSRILLPALILLACLAPGALAQGPSELVTYDAVRFWPSEATRDPGRPSVALVAPVEVLGAAPEGFPVAPRFERLHERHAVRIAVEPGTSLYGTGEVPGPLLRNGRATTLWNYDAYGWDDATPQLYQSHPWVLAVRPDGTAFGVLFDTTWRSRVELLDGILFIADGPPYPVIVIDRDSPQAVLATLADLTGHMPMPPLWALGYHQCRYSYTPQKRAREVAEGFRERHIPCDVIWLDIDYMDGFRCFTFDPSSFSDPAGLDANLDAMGFKTIWMIDPGIKSEPGYAVYDQGTAAGAWVKDASGKPFIGRVWPGECVFPDFTSARVREWWGGLYRDFLSVGIDGVWNDMNEPAVFDVPTKTMPVDNWHRADPELGGPDVHARYHNVYGMQMVRATREGVRAARPEKRPFVLSRANHLGGQRYAAAWTGDNTANWYHLDVSIPMILNLGLSGQPFSGPDIGGYARGGTGTMFGRWMGIGALLPFARGHTGKGEIDKEPWAFGPEVEATCREALDRRYRLMPYLYTLFREASTTGLPVARPLFFADPADTALRAEDEAFLLGANVLVAARTNPQNTDAFPMPRGIWRRFDCGVGDDANPELPDLYLRGGSVLPLAPLMEYTGEKPWDPLEVIVSLDENGRAEGTLYEDAGDGYGYERGEYRLVRFSAERTGDAVTVTPVVVEGDWPLPERRVVVRVLE